MGNNLSGNGPEPSRLKVRESLLDLLAGVHHERSVVDNGLTDRLSPE